MLAGPQGLEPQISVPKTDVIPFHQGPIIIQYTLEQSQSQVLTIKTKCNILISANVVELNTSLLQKVECRETGFVSTQSHHPYHRS